MKKVDNQKIERLNKKRYAKKLKRKHIPSNRYLTKKFKKSVYVNEAPKHFSFVSNTEEMLTYFNIGKQEINNKREVQFNLRNIEILKPDGIAIFASYFTDDRYCECIVKKKRPERILLHGTAPLNDDLKKMLIGSGFYDHVNCAKQYKRSKNNFLLHKVTKHKVEPKNAKQATDFVKKSLGNTQPFRPVYEILIELMANTNNHASNENDGEYNWWIYVFYDESTNVTSYSFLDFGVGIFESLQVLKFKDYLLYFFKKKKNRLDLAKDLLEGKISSRTGLNERGRGFTCVKKNAERSEFKKFIIISNDVYIDIKTETYEHLKQDFAGTFYYWEISNGN